MKKCCPFSSQALTVASLPLPPSNPYLSLPEEIENTLQNLLQKPDFKVLDESRLTRYQRDFKELLVLGKGNTSTVTLCKHRIDGCYYAIKQISLFNPQQKNSLMYDSLHSCDDKKESKEGSLSSQCHELWSLFSMTYRRVSIHHTLLFVLGRGSVFLYSTRICILW